MPTGTCTLGAGWTGRRRGLDSTCTQAGPSTAASGRRISTRAGELSPGLTEHGTREGIWTAKNTGTECLCGAIRAGTRGSLWKILYTAWGSTTGVMGEYTLETGKTIKWRGKETLHGVMEGGILGTIGTIKNMDMEFLSGLIIGSTKGHVWMGNSMAGASIQLRRVRLRESGGMESG